VLVANEYKEMVVTGVDVASYGKDLVGTPSLGRMLKELLTAVPELPRLRLSSVDPAEVDPDLEELFETEPRLMPHLHLSVQAGCDLVLKRMRRRHLRSDVIRVAGRLRGLRPDITFGADLIAGFPTEDEAMFARTLDLVEEAGLTYLHVFPYSVRTGTPAARMPQVPKEARKERAARLRVAGEARLDAFLRDQLGRRRRVLVERGGVGHTDQFAPVRFERAEAAPTPGTIAEYGMAGLGGGVLLARAVA
jgi:threonylcarbamoyladenosine tRNA methylthiotransferase MtaB